LVLLRRRKLVIDFRTYIRIIVFFAVFGREVVAQNWGREGG
jgi:hypothetical protein